mgnify:CR=1 FL=1
MVIPAAVRASLDIQPGDRLRLSVQDGEVRLVPARALIQAIWANNTGGDAGDAVGDVRTSRSEDRARVDLKWDRVEAAVQANERDDDEIAHDLLNALGLAP